MNINIEKGTVEPTLNDILMNIPQQKIEKWVHLQKIIEIGRNEGFCDLATKRKVWPLILEIQFEKVKGNISNWRLNQGQHSSEYDQLKKDAMRSFFSLKEFQGISQEELKKNQFQLLQILDAFAVHQPQYKYFQGFHDIATIFIAVFGVQMAYHLSYRLAKTYLRDLFLFSFDQTITVLDKLIYQIVTEQDKDFIEIFQQFEDKRLSFTMPWIITWFAHSFEDMEIILRIWDFLLSSQASSIIFLAAALIISQKQKLSAFCSGMYDMGMIHCYFQNLRKQKIDIQQIIKFAIFLEDSLILTSLQSYPKLHKDTVIIETNFLQNSKIHTKLKKIQHNRKTIRKIFVYGISAIAIGLATYLLLPSSNKYRLQEL